MVIKYFNMPARTLAPSLSRSSLSLFPSLCPLLSLFLRVYFSFWVFGFGVSAVRLCLGAGPAAELPAARRQTDAPLLAVLMVATVVANCQRAACWGSPTYYTLLLSLSASSFPCTLLAPTLAVSAIELLPLCSSCSLKFLFFFGCIHCKQWCVYLVAKS